MAEQEVVLKISGLNKRFGRIHAVNSLNLEVKRGMVFGMLGPNGSGKTTTLGMLLGATTPDSGTFTWFGKGNDHEVRKKVGAILEKPVFYPYMSAIENLELVCLIKEVPFSRIPEVLKTVGLGERGHDDFKTFSLGMKQRLAIASALLCDPVVMILDEPTNGLDPQGIADIRGLILEIAASGKTIILASHLLDEVQRVCTDFCVLSKGKLLYSGNVGTDLGAENTFDLGSNDMAVLKKTLETMDGISVIEENHEVLRIKITGSQSAASINAELAAKGIFLHHLVAGKKSLEQQFLKILQENPS